MVKHLRLHSGEAILGIPVSRGLRQSLLKWVSMVSLIVFCAVFASQGIAGAASPFGDVEKSHWSYETLAEFAEAGLIDGYSKEAFTGDRLITRYEMAWAISRVVPVSLSLRQLELLVRLQEEFALELSLLAGADRYISPAGSDPKELATGSFGLSSTSTISPISTGPNPETISGGKRLSEILGTERDNSQGISAGNPSKTISIPLDAGAKAELSLGEQDQGLGKSQVKAMMS